MTDSPLTALQHWYLQQCDGDWEHAYGISIGTLDNPGWTVTIDLAGTSLSGRAFERVEDHRSESDWVVCGVADDRFEAAAGASNLGEALVRFLSWAAEA